MQRREFLIRSAAFLAGTMLGLKPLSEVLAAGNDPGSNPFFPIPSRTAKPKLALIIDDFGESHSRADRFLDLGLPITFAILPRLNKSVDLAYKIHAAGHETLLHQPMEPHALGVDPGPGALYVGDDPEKIAAILSENIAEIPFISGVNNHMGSRFTEAPKEMWDTLSLIKERDLCFVDSMTSGHSKGYRTARTLQMRTAYRHVFLDNLLEEQAVLNQLRLLKQYALHHGQAIGIGHPFPETAGAISRFKPELLDPGISLVYVSGMIRT